MLYVDARRFSVNQFYRAVDIGWCLRQNELHRPAGRNDGDPVYPEDMYQGVLQYVYNSGILDHVDHDPAIGSVIGGRLMNDIIRRCRSRYTQTAFLKSHLFKHSSIGSFSSVLWQIIMGE